MNGRKAFTEPQRLIIFLKESTEEISGNRKVQKIGSLAGAVEMVIYGEFKPEHRHYGL